MLVSVIIPTYNTEKNLLKKTLDSVLSQDYNELEIIVVDDGSKEPFAGLNKEYKDPHIVWHKLNKNRGPAYARNVGVDIAKGELIAFLDAGDYWDKTKIRKQVKLYKSLSTPAVIYCGAKFKLENKKRVLLPQHKGYVFKELLVKNIVIGSCSSVLLPKKMFWEVGGFYVEKDIPEDWDLWVKLSKKYPFDYIKEPLVIILKNPNSRSYNAYLKTKTYFRFLCKYKEELIENDLLNPALANYFHVISALYREQKNYKMAFYYSLAEASFNLSFKKICKVFLSILEVLIKRDIINNFYYK